MLRIQQHQPATSKTRISSMNRSLCILAVALVASVAGSVPSSFADENEEFYENPMVYEDMRVMPEKRSSRGLDPMAGITFGSIKKRIDSLSGDSFGSIKKRIDSLSGDSFGAQKRSDESKVGKFIRKNLAAEHELMSGLNSHEAFDRHLADRESAYLMPKKASLPYPYYLSYAPVYYRVKDKGI